MRDCSPGPMLRTYAVVALKARILRKSSACAPSIVSFSQWSPPSTVRSTVPLAPLAQATLLETALMTRSETSVPLAWGCQCATVGATATRSQIRNRINILRILVSQMPPASSRYCKDHCRGQNDVVISSIHTKVSRGVFHAVCQNFPGGFDGLILRGNPSCIRNG